MGRVSTILLICGEVQKRVFQCSGGFSFKALFTTFTYGSPYYWLSIPQRTLQRGGYFSPYLKDERAWISRPLYCLRWIPFQNESIGHSKGPNSQAFGQSVSWCLSGWSLWHQQKY